MELPTISPKYQMQLIGNLEKNLWEEYKDPETIDHYIRKWHQTWDGGYNSYPEENFRLIRDNKGHLVITETLHGMEGTLLIEMAIDMWIETPDFIPVVPTFKNTLKQNYQTAYATFQKALKLTVENPSLAIGLANSTLESIIKHILEDPNVAQTFDRNNTSYDLAQELLKYFSLFPGKTQELEEIKEIGSWLLRAVKGIEKMRSEKTDFHGKTEKDYLVNDIVYVCFLINAVSTIGMFLMGFYQAKFKPAFTPASAKEEEIHLEDIPF